MSSLIRREAWVDPKAPVIGPAGNLSKIDAIVIHYPGVNPGALNLDNPVQVLRNTHTFYMHKSPPYAIGYNFATFPSGRFELRGFDIKNAANLNHNDHTLAINVMVNGADEATPTQVEYTRDMVADIFAHLGRTVPLIAHGDLSGASTACPGAGIRRQMLAGAFNPATKPKPIETPSTEDQDMAKLVKCDDGDAAAFSVTGITLSWIDNPEDLAVAQKRKTVPGSVEMWPRDDFRSFRLVGACPPGWSTIPGVSFREVI